MIENKSTNLSTQEGRKININPKKKRDITKIMQKKYLENVKSAEMINEKLFVKT